MIQGQKDDRAARGYARALNVYVETSRSAATQKAEKPTADDRPSRAEQDVHDGSLARGGDHFAGGQPQQGPQQNPNDHRHEAL